MKMLKITQCRDPLMWYAGLVGELVPYYGRWPEAYKSREPAGYINRVEFDDAEIVTIEDDLKSGEREASQSSVICKQCLREMADAPARRFRGPGYLEQTGYIPAGSADEREG